MGVAVGELFWPREKTILIRSNFPSRPRMGRVPTVVPRTQMQSRLADHYTTALPRLCRVRGEAQQRHVEIIECRVGGNSRAALARGDDCNVPRV